LDAQKELNNSPKHFRAVSFMTGHTQKDPKTSGEQHVTPQGNKKNSEWLSQKQTTLEGVYEE
jgi:hypothetical protein